MKKVIDIAILSTVKKIIPYIETTSGYVKYMLSSQAVSMDSDDTLQDTIDNVTEQLDTINSDILTAKLSSDLYSFQSHWQILAWNTWQKGSFIYFNAELYTTSVIQANYTYTFNDSTTMDASVKADGMWFLNLVATDMSFHSVIPGYARINNSGSINFSLPETGRTYLILTGVYKAQGGLSIQNGDEVSY